MSEGDLGDGVEGVSEIGFEWEWNLRWVSGGNFEDGVEGVSEIGFEHK